MGHGARKRGGCTLEEGEEKKKKRNEKIKMCLVEAISLPSEPTIREVGDNRVMMDDKEHKRKVKKEKKVKSIKESELNVILEKDVINGSDHVRRKKKKRKLEPNDKNNGLEFISKEETNNLKKEKGGKLKKDKCMERKREKRDKSKVVVSSTSAEICRGKEEGIKETNGLDQSEKKDVSNIKKYEGQHETQKKQMKVKRVKFSDHDEFFPLSDATVVGEEHEEQKLVHGKRFSKEEDQMLKDAVNNYIEVYGLGENGLRMVLNCKSFPETRQCWKEIATALPWRPQRSIYWRAHNLFTRGEPRTWTAEEKAHIMKYHDENGPIWTMMAKVLGKNRTHIKDVWRAMKYPNLKKGHWSQDEYQILFELVNLDLQMKVHVEKNTKHGMLRDNISWTAISEKLSTRTYSGCSSKWYRGLKSSMGNSREWDDSDDYRLLDELLRLDACCVEDVDWDNLINKRSGEVCLKRWKQMCLHIGYHGIKPFAEQVEVLAKRYCPNLLEVREAFDSRPIVE